jgi:hypothetical protein
MVASSLLIILIVCLSFRLDGLTGKLPEIGWRETCGARILELASRITVC